MFYEGIKRETCRFLPFSFLNLSEYIECPLAILLPSTSDAYSAGIHGFSAAAAGAIATMATHPFDVIKVHDPLQSKVMVLTLCRRRYKYGVKIVIKVL